VSEGEDSLGGIATVGEPDDWIGLKRQICVPSPLSGQSRLATRQLESRIRFPLRLNTLWLVSIKAIKLFSRLRMSRVSFPRSRPLKRPAEERRRATRIHSLFATFLNRRIACALRTRVASCAPKHRRSRSAKRANARVRRCIMRIRGIRDARGSFL